MTDQFFSRSHAPRLGKNSDLPFVASTLVLKNQRSKALTTNWIGNTFPASERGNENGALFFNPEGVAAIAQGCGVAATLGKRQYTRNNPEGVVATYRCGCNPFRVDDCSSPEPRVAPSAQPWAIAATPSGLDCKQSLPRRGRFSIVHCPLFIAAPRRGTGGRRRGEVLGAVDGGVGETAGLR